MKIDGGHWQIETVVVMGHDSGVASIPGKSYQVLHVRGRTVALTDEQMTALMAAYTDRGRMNALVDRLSITEAERLQDQVERLSAATGVKEHHVDAIREGE